MIKNINAVALDTKYLMGLINNNSPFSLKHNHTDALRIQIFATFILDFAANLIMKVVFNRTAVVRDTGLLQNKDRIWT